MKEIHELSAATLTLPLRGTGLEGVATLGDLVRDPTLLAFLRHGG